MTQPMSTPVIPPQPAAPFYGLGELALFKSFTRESYRAQFGVEAPPFDPARVPKGWFDSTVDTSHPEDVVLYKAAGRDRNGAWGLRQLVLPAAEAANVNLPGAISYAPYLVPATAVTRGDAPVNPNYLSLEADARALMREIGGEAVVEEDLAMFPAIYPFTERRRAWNVVWRGRNLNAGLLLLNRNAKGIGYPGQWDLSGEEPVFRFDPPAPTGIGDTRGWREMPLRDLLANEVIQMTLTGVGVQRTDLAREAAQASGQFTAADRALLQAVFDAVVKRT